MAKGEPWIIFLQKGCGVRQKYEEVYLHDYTSPREARQALTRYFEFYNQERPHQALDYQTPAEVYFHTTSRTVG
jgi:transposase InsO family protein